MSFLRSTTQFLAVCALAATSCFGEKIAWFNNPGASNQDALGQTMGSGFEFSLGVFANNFSPTAQNTGEWLTHWRPAATTAYNSGTQRFAAQYEVTDNTAPFTVGAAGWIFGRKETNGVREWILFRRNTWNWPAPNPANPFQVNWNVETANQVVFGTVNTGGSPFLMKTAFVPITYDQWKVAALAGEVKNAPNDDPDRDGESNLIEFVFNTNPLNSTSQPGITRSLANGHATYSLARRADHSADLVVQVSGNLVDWQSGPAHVETLVQNHQLLSVRDLTPLASAPGRKRFMRIQVTLPTPPAP